MQKIERSQLNFISGGTSSASGANKTSSNVNVAWDKNGGSIVITPTAKS
jgi:hypothetical protein